MSFTITKAAHKFKDLDVGEECGINGEKWVKTEMVFDEKGCQYNCFCFDTKRLSVFNDDFNVESDRDMVEVHTLEEGEMCLFEDDLCRVYDLRYEGVTLNGLKGRYDLDNTDKVLKVSAVEVKA